MLVFRICLGSRERLADVGRGAARRFSGCDALFGTKRSFCGRIIANSISKRRNRGSNVVCRRGSALAIELIALLLRARWRCLGTLLRNAEVARKRGRGIQIGSDFVHGVISYCCFRDPPPHIISASARKKLDCSRPPSVFSHGLLRVLVPEQGRKSWNVYFENKPWSHSERSTLRNVSISKVKFFLKMVTLIGDKARKGCCIKLTWTNRTWREFLLNLGSKILGVFWMI